ncbi:hypothetical protein DFJ73DRAFT_795315 [Zopfochytrium polystomum]|nr:hypothetical protein DFJ73DRAFT_795315 [Zopfochytrium polystomum]
MRREREIAPTHELDLQGWSQRMLDGLRGRMRLLWTVRTTNSVTVTGIHPVRHTQLMLPVVRAPEQVVHTFDLDSVCVFYDGLQVYATARSLRAFNTRTNFVDLRSVQDRARAHRMIKYRDRGFATAVFDICRHDPRCDVRATARVRASIRRSFPEYVLQCGSPPHLKTDAFPVPLDPDDDRGLDPPISKLQEVGFDYRPAPLVYEEWIGASELREQIELLESGRYEIEEDDIRTFAPVLKKLPYAITQDPIKFADCLMVAERNLIAMQFKFVKDDWLDRRLWIASALHFCHMCGKDVSAADGSTSALKSPKDSELDDDNMDDVESNDGKSDNDELDDDESGLDDRSMAEPSWDSASTGSLNSGSEPESSSADEPANRRPSRNQPPKPSCAATCCQCANLNAEMRTKTVDLRGTVALVTATGEPGALARRVVLRLLRMGATVHVAARLPHLLLAELRKEVNADLWWDRVWVHKVDMADLASVVEIAEVWAATMARLDVVVHIAAMRNVLREGSGEAWERRARDDALLGASMDEETLRPWMRAQRQDATAAGLAAADIATLLAPLGLDNQLLRSISVMAATGVPPAAAAGVDAADVSGTAAAAGILAPAVLLQKLRPLLAASTAKAHPSVRVRASFVVHVLPLGGSMEPAMPQPADRDCMAKNFNSSCSSSSSSSTQALHVEMAEAAIARLTLTVAGPLAAADGIYLTAVDPGWVSTGTAPEAVAALALADKSKPRRGASRMGELLPPLEIEDGAARVLDPVVRGLSEGVLLKGVLLRNFKQSSW